MSEQGTTKDLSSVRRRAWETRRAKYGPKGHSGGAYSQTLARRSLVSMARDEISQARRSCQLLLPEKAAHRAIDRLDNADQILERI